MDKLSVALRSILKEIEEIKKQRRYSIYTEHENKNFFWEISKKNCGWMVENKSCVKIKEANE